MEKTLVKFYLCSKGMLSLVYEGYDTINAYLLRIDKLNFTMIEVDLGEHLLRCSSIGW